jgi:CDP-diglyceride synthetase
MLASFKERLQLNRPILLPLAFYLVLLVISTTWLDDNPASPWRYIVVLLPMIPCIFIALGALQVFRNLDELEQKIRLESMAFSFIITLFLVFSMGLLSMVGVPQVNSTFIALLMALLWLGGKLWLNQRYR